MDGRFIIIYLKKVNKNNGKLLNLINFFFFGDGDCNLYFWLIFMLYGVMG